MLIPLEAEVESLHASAAAFFRPQSSSLRDPQHPAGWDRARLFDSERFERKFVTTLADLRGELGFRIVAYVLIPQGGTLTYCSGPRTPPIEEQVAIGGFLRGASAQIARFIRAKRRLIELLNEQKQAIIQRAVTRGLDPNVRLKPSGIDWLGDVPEHWSVAPLKRIKALTPNSFVDGPFGSNLKSEHYVEGGDVYVVESGFVTSGQFVWKKFKTITREHFQTVSRSSCKGGDIVIAKIGARYGMAAILPELDKPAVVSGNSLKLTINETRYDRRYIHLSLLCARFRGAFFHFANATAQPALSLRALNNLSLPTPGIDEQRGIVQGVGEQTREVDLALHQTACEITLLREYRTRLIADVVTGKLDVRCVELPQPEEAEELPPVGDEIADKATEEGDELEPAEDVTDAAG